jgi:hypothetical protein
MTSPESFPEETEPGPEPRPEREGTVLDDPSAADLVIGDITHESQPHEVAVFDVEALQEGESPADPNLPVEIVVTDQTLIADLGADGSSGHSSEITLATETARIDAVGSGVGRHRGMPPMWVDL